MAIHNEIQDEVVEQIISVGADRELVRDLLFIPQKAGNEFCLAIRRLFDAG
jgi:hypothetical protein